MKQILKSLMFGTLYFLMSCIVTILGYTTWGGFSVVHTTAGWEAVWFVFASLITGVLTVFTIFTMGVIPFAIIDDLKQKLSKWEDKEDD